MNRCQRTATLRNIRYYGSDHAERKVLRPFAFISGLDDAIRKLSANTKRHRGKDIRRAGRAFGVRVRVKH